MIRLNLLPHRELKRKARQQQFAVLAGITFFLGLLTVGMVHIMITGQIEHQESRNDYMKNQIAILDKQIDEIKQIRAQTQALLARKKVVETLQDNRSDVVHLLDQLVRLLPDGVYLRSIKQTNQTINLTGYAQSNARVSTLMRKLESSPWLGLPSLVEIKASKVNNARLNAFSLNVTLVRSSQSAADGNSTQDIAKL
ncbi:MAG: PilN domain-containing protein [Nitrosomonadaceae bacterium]|jgi:type IV pilus assembly protein PilN|nr:PilN domain-containing protein [Nitrosomonadaceae bacterium]